MMASELSPRGTKCSLEEDEKEDDIDDYGPYRSDDSDYETDRNPQPGRRIWNRYMRECRESEGFDITVFPGTADNVTIVPMTKYLNIPKEKQKYTDLCSMAIRDFNSQNVSAFFLNIFNSERVTSFPNPGSSGNSLSISLVVGLSSEYTIPSPDPTCGIIVGTLPLLFVCVVCMCLWEHIHSSVSFLFKGKNYVFVDLVSVNASFAAGVWYYFTFRAEDKTEGLKTFQALVWDGINGHRYAEFCRPKKNQGACGRWCTCAYVALAVPAI